jgi:hypothetical protein
MVVMPVGVMVAVVMAVIVAQQPGADEIDAEAEHRDRDGLAIGDGHRMSEACNAFVGDLNGNHGQDDRTGKGSEVAEFAGAKRETRIARLPSRKQIGQGGDPERGSMGRHVPAIGQQRHRSGEPPPRDFTNHHHRGQPDHEPDAAFVLMMAGTQKDVIVRPLVDRMGVHGRFLRNDADSAYRI